MHQQAYTYLIKAEEYVPTTLFLEKAKLHWLREEHEQALTTLQRGLEIILPQGSEMTGLSLETRYLCHAIFLVNNIYFYSLEKCVQKLSCLLQLTMTKCLMLMLK